MSEIRYVQLLDYKPRPYAPAIQQFMLDTPRCNIWAAPGMGKTVMVLTVLDWLRICGSSFFPALVIGPKRVVRDVWPYEVAKWAHTHHMRCIPILGTPAQRLDALKKRKAEIYVVNYENLEWLVETFGAKWPFGIVIADEARRLKGFRLNKGGKRSTALSKTVQHTGRWINLTGTPATNGYTDLWGQQWFVDFGERLGRSFTEYTNRWFRVNQYTHKIEPMTGAIQEIDTKLADCAISLRVEDWFDVKDLIQKQIRIELPPEARKTYEAMETDFFAQLASGEITAQNAAVKSMKLIQITNGAVYDSERTWHAIHDRKLEALDSLVEETGGAPLLVVYHFKYDLERLQKAFPQSRVMKSKQDENDWNAGKIPMALIHAQSAGHGLNLQHGGNIVVMYTNTWDLELRLQVIERIGQARQAQSGYDRPVYVYDLVVDDSIETAVIDALLEKKTIQDSLLFSRSYRKC